MKYMIGDRERIIRLCIIALVIILGLNIVAMAINDPPPSEESGLWKNLTKRLKDNSSYWPHNVNDTLNSSDPNIGFNITTNCPNGSKVNRTEIKVITTFVHWNTTKYPNATNASGYYEWNYSWTITGTSSNKTKSIIANNILMVNYTYMETLENNTLGRSVNEGILYHELLHGQLLIDAMKGNNSWINDVCNCSFSYGPAGGENDSVHSQIYSYEGQYVNDTANASGYTIIRKTYVVKSHNNSFNTTIDVTADLNGKDNVTGFVYPVSDNVWIVFYYQREYGVFYIEGNITGKDGTIRLIVDPPNIGIIGDITIISDSPSLPPITPPPTIPITTPPPIEVSSQEHYVYPSLNIYGLIILIICLVIVSILRFKKKI